MIPIYERIRIARKKCGLSQYDLADKIKFLNQSQISKIETGNRSITARDLVGISNALNVPIEKLMIEKENDDICKN